MFIPLRDDNALKSIRYQYVTISLIAVKVLVYIFEASGLDEGAIRSFGVTPRAYGRQSVLDAAVDRGG